MSDLAKAFAGLKQAQAGVPGDRSTSQGWQEPERPGTRAPKLAGTQVTKPGPRLAKPQPLQGTAKSSHPEYTAVKVFLRRDTHKAAGRKWEDADGGDFSDLVEQLLEKYLGN
jgi:hypothetical protein